MGTNDEKNSLSLSPTGGCSSKDDTPTGSQISELSDTTNKKQDLPAHGHAKEKTAPSQTDSTRSQEVKSECQRSVKFNPLGTYAPVPSDFDAMLARQSMPKNEKAFNYDKKRREMVQDVLYKQGGYVIDRKDKQMKKVEPGTPLPPPPLPKSKTIRQAPAPPKPAVSGTDTPPAPPPPNSPATIQPPNPANSQDKQNK